MGDSLVLNSISHKNWNRFTGGSDHKNIHETASEISQLTDEQSRLLKYHRNSCGNKYTEEYNLKTRYANTNSNTLSSLRGVFMPTCKNHRGDLAEEEILSNSHMSTGRISP